MRLCIILAAVALTSCGQIPEQSENCALQGFYYSPEKIIQQFEPMPEKTASRYFMLGQAYKKTKDLKKALLCFSNSCFVNRRNTKLKLYPQPVYSFITSRFQAKSRFYEDSVYEIAELMYSYREYDYTVKFLDLISRENQGLYYDAAILRARVLTSAGRWKEAVTFLNGMLTDAPADSIKNELLLKRAAAYENGKEPVSAALDYLSIISATSGAGWKAEAAAGRIFQLIKNGSVKPDQETALKIEKALFSAGKFTEAAELIQALPPAGETSELYYRCLIRAGKLNEAEKISPAISESRKILADELWNSGKKDQAVNIYIKQINSGESDLKEQSLYRTASFFFERNRKGACDYGALYVKNFPENENAHKMLWNLARAALVSGDTNSAEKYIQENLASWPEGRYSDQCRFWMYKIAVKKQAKNAETFAVSLITMNPDSPYTYILLENTAQNTASRILAGEFASALEKHETGRALFCHALLCVSEKDPSEKNRRLRDLPESITASFKQTAFLMEEASSGRFRNRQLALLKKYFSTGYTEGIERVLETVPETDPEMDAAMTSLALEYGIPFYSVRYGQELLKKQGLKENLFLMPDTLASAVLPRPFHKTVAENAARSGTDEASVYSLIKAESLFSHRAVSPVGAAGLMQLMPGTAAETAKNLHMTEFDLKKPEDSIALGSAYLGWLSRYYKNNFVYTVAAYNAGPGNVNMWIKDLKNTDDDYFTECSVFTETRYYILRTRKYRLQYLMTGEKK